MSNLPDAATLKRAANLIQAAHDAIEIYGFDIDRYGDYGNHEEVKAARLTSAPMCYIGSLRFAAGLEPTPKGSAEIAAMGDGPELVVALKYLDSIAKRRMDPSRRAKVRGRYKGDVTMYLRDLADPEIRSEYEDAEELERFLHEYPDDIMSVGRFVEEFGFQIREKGYAQFGTFGTRLLGRPFDEQLAWEQEYALKLLRSALTKIYKDMES